jgi:hypothetical protein
MEVDDETRTSTQLHERNQRKKLLKSQEHKIRRKYSKNHTKKKNGMHTWRLDSIIKISYIDKNQTSTRYGNHTNILPLFKRLRRISHNLSTLLLHLKHTTPPKRLNLNQGVEEGWLKCLPLHQLLESYL